MTSLDTLVDLHQQRFDEARARVTEIETERDGARARSERLTAELAAERRAAAESYEAGRVFPAFAARIAERQGVLAEEIRVLDEAIAEAREVVVAAYRELKKYEISRDLREECDKTEEARRERARLDEIGASRYRRKRAN